ncbi:hypothetical protein OAG74_00415 [Verrucomicrobia bacterium]|nr:hypothetical protein [Verrucomicrobiota bacterium]
MAAVSAVWFELRKRQSLDDVAARPSIAFASVLLDQLHCMRILGTDLSISSLYVILPVSYGKLLR